MRQIDQHEKGMTLADQLRESGYAVLEQAVPAERLDRHEHAVREAAEHSCCGHNMSLSQVSPEQRHTFLRELNLLDYGHGGECPLAFVPGIRARMEEVFGEEPVLSSTRTSLWEGGDRAAHFDTSILSTSPEHGAYRTWCALEDIHPDSGVFYVVPGTHRSVPEEVCNAVLERPGVRSALGDLAGAYEAVGRDLHAIHERAEWKRFHALAWPQICAATNEAVRGLERKTFPLRKGDVVVFSPRVVHGTMPRLDTSLPRKCQISEWRARTARLHFVTEYFGSQHDRRGDPGAGHPADGDAVEAIWGAYIAPR